jgi:ribose transport system substrate-binding protein
MTQSRKLVQGRESPNETASVSRACDILNLLVQQNAALRLTDVARLTGINKATVYRILSTLSNHKLVSKTASNEYVSVLNKRVPSGIRIGYASQTDEFAFSRAVTAGIVASSREAGIELFMLDNSYSPTAALQNADALIKEGVQLVIEFQTDASVAALISTKLNERHIPLIAIEIPHPNAVYFGVNNIQAGLAGGRHLARWSIDNWSGQVDQLLLVGLAKAGSLPGSRLTGILLGLREVFPQFEDSRVCMLDGNGQHEEYSRWRNQRSERPRRTSGISRFGKGKTLCDHGPKCKQ